MKCRSISFVAIAVLFWCCITFATSISNIQDEFSSTSGSFPGVSRDLASFCAARPSLPIDLAAMVVHVKKNISFNYKLYLFSADHVFQTGQVIPRDDFRIHSFPVKLKRLSEFWPTNVPTYKRTSNEQDKPVQVPSNSFNLREFLGPVPLMPHRHREMKKKLNNNKRKRKPRTPPAVIKIHPDSRLPEDARGESLPGDPSSFISHDVARVLEEKAARGRSDDDEQLETSQGSFNSHIQFDRDDQVSVSRRAYALADESADKSEERKGEDDSRKRRAGANEQLALADSVIPVGAFSSFHVNLTYLVRKDFDQLEPQLIRLQIDAMQFKVIQLQLIENNISSITPTLSVQHNLNGQQHQGDYNFLHHKLMRDPNTRITAINQIYEDWITRNFYTIVYIQRRLDETNEATNEQKIVTDKLVFRGTSMALLGADQLAYNVKAAAFITEKNGLHYYLEFLTNHKFYVCAVDWTKRPFKMLDSQRFPIKATRTQLDNEELLLCPPAVCYSSQPIDEVVSYGRLALPDRVQREASILSSSLSSFATSGETTTINHPPGSLNSINNETNLTYNEQVNASQKSRLSERHAENGNSEELSLEISLDSVIEAVRAAANRLQTRLHLRDWVWILPRSAQKGAFELHYEQARRNDIKAKPDNYGYVLTGHEIDASYRAYNELFLISANHLITINYTMANETVISAHPLGDEFYGLSSTIIDPITGAFYDRYANQLYFFKGDRYVGYDYATKKPLEEFQLEAPAQEPQATSSGQTLVSSLPVVGALGRQHQVDGVYHDFSSDLVYVFSGMKFYTFDASEFKHGSLKPESQSLPRMLCINEHFLNGCTFDQVYRNPCRNDDDDNKNKSAKLQQKNGDLTNDVSIESQDDEGNETTISHRIPPQKSLNFYEEQQMKLRSIASRPRLLDLIIENSILSRTGATKVFQSNVPSAEPQDMIVTYLLIAMSLMIVLVAIVVIAVLINWAKMKPANESKGDDQMRGHEVRLERSTNQQPAIGHQYLANQHQHSQRHHMNHHPRAREATGGRGSSSIGISPLGSVNVVVSKSNRHRQNGVDISAL